MRDKIAILPAGQPEPRIAMFYRPRFAALMFALVAPFAVAQVDSRPLTDADRPPASRRR